MSALGVTFWVFIVIGGLLVLGGLGAGVWWIAQRLGLVGWAEKVGGDEQAKE